MMDVHVSNKSAVVAHACISSWGDWEQESQGVQDHPQQHGKLQASQEYIKTCHKEKMNKTDFHVHINSLFGPV